MRVLVPGGAGYVGSHCVRRLVAAGHDVTVYDNLSYGHPEAVTPPARLVEGDLADPAQLSEVLRSERFDAVMHFAALLNVGESVARPLEYYRNNVANTLNLLECMRDAGVRRLVFSSTCAVYGEPEELPLREDLPKSPISPYGTSKLAMEWLLEHSATAWGLGAVALRYFNAAGAAADGSLGEDHHPEIHLIPLVLKVALGQLPVIKIFGTDYPTPDGSCIRDYVHVEDLAEAHLLALERMEPGRFDAFNVGTGQGTSVLEVISAAKTVTGRPIPAESVGRRPGDPPALYADAQHIWLRYGWKARHRDIESVVASAWKWHQSHPSGYASVAGSAAVPARR